MHYIETTEQLTTLLDRTQGPIDIEAPDGAEIEIHRPRIVNLRKGAVTLINYAEDGEAINYATGGRGVNYAVGGTAVNYGADGIAINYADGGAAVNYAVDGEVHNFGEDGGQLD